MSASKRGQRRTDLTDRVVLDVIEKARRTAPTRWRGEAASVLGIHASALRSRIETLKRHGRMPDQLAAPVEPQLADKGFLVDALPEGDIPIDELVAQRKRQFQYKARHEEAAKLLPVTVTMRGAIGLLHFGDPHVDDDGTDIEALERHTQLVRDTPGLFGCNVGDTLNNWTGRLARLYAEQSTSAAQAWRLAEWFVRRCDWLYMIAGNHDLWSGAGDPLKWIAKQQGSLYTSSECRMALKFPGGLVVRVNARHDFAGSSIWNPAHGPMKAAIMGTRDHLYVAGHKHESAYSVLKDANTGIAMHALKVASYKRFDRYAREKGFRDQAFSPCAVTVINPALPETHPDLIKIFWEPEAGADYLTWLRRRD
jgi:hypothetical protein